jgi:hypothetical protein
LEWFGILTKIEEKILILNSAEKYTKMIF